MAEPNLPATDPVTPNNQQTFVSIHNTPFVYKSSSHVDGQDERLPKPELNRDRLNKFLREEMLDSTADDTDGLLELAFPESSLPISVDDAVNLLVEKDLLAKEESTLVWTADLAALKTYNRSDGTHPEDHLKRFLNRIGDVLLESGPNDDSRRWSTVATATALPGGPAQRKPDLVLTSELKDEDVTWKKVHSTLQLKSSHKPKHCRAAAEQLSSDAFMAFSSQNTRRFFLGVSICAYTVRIYAFNRAGRVSSVPFSIDDDPRALVHLLIGLILCPTNLLGLDASYIWKDNYFLLKVDGVVYRLLECVFRSKTIRGRGTTCWRAVRNDNPDGPEYAIKDTWTDTSRTPEAELMKKLKGVEGIPDLIAFEKLAHADGRDVTSYFRQNVEEKQTNGKGKQKRDVEVRQHWILVTFPFAQPLASFSSKKELLSALVDTIKAHRGMLTKSVLHRDISLDNLMIYNPTKARKLLHDANGPNGPEQLPLFVSKKGLLIDVDYSVELTQGAGDRKIAVGHRTGTLPFMAIEILEGDASVHGSHHDLESIFYVLVWICIFYRGPNNSPRFRPLDKATSSWTGIDDISTTNIAFAKMATFKITDQFDKYLKSNAATYFRNLIPCLQELRSMFFNDASTATHENMIEILERHLKELPDVDDWVDDEKPVPTKKRGRNASAERPPIKRMRTHESSQQTRSLPQRMTRLQLTQSTSSQGEIDEGSEDDDDDAENKDEEDSGDEESDDEERDPTYRHK